ncbi:MAG: class I SAM-dependent methyltransferase [Rhodospirillaceae bacterium]|nr:class I SAM-dependent methyltransferase [Rhodospirillaceae bacterium]
MSDQPSTSPASDHDRCPVCEKVACAPFVEKNGYAFLKCPDCGYIFCHPRPSQDQLADVYSMGDAALGIAEGFYPKASSRKRRAFLNALRLWRYVWNKRVLDLGCGGGFIVDAMRKVGAKEAVGIDINPNAIDYAKKHYPRCSFHLGSFDQVGDVARDFDFVYSSEVIEHVEDVEGYVEFLTRAVRPNGVLFLTTPDIASSLVPENPTDWPVFDPPQHIQFFKQENLTHLMARYGFSAIRRVADPGGAGLKMLFRRKIS